MDERSEKTTSSVTSNNEELVRKLKDNLEVRDRRWRTKTYKQCFLHSDAVNFLQTDSGVDEESAVSTLNELRTAGYIQHAVDPNKPFKVSQRGKLYFCFLDDESAHVNQKQKAFAAMKCFKPLSDVSERLVVGNKEKKLTPQVLQDVFLASPEAQSLKTKLTRLESAFEHINAKEVSTVTKLEIVHQATISLIRGVVAMAFLVLILVGYTLYVVVPSLHQSRNIMLTTFLLGTLCIGAFVVQGMHLFSVWLQVESCLIQAAEGEDAVEDYEIDVMSVATTDSAVSATGKTSLIPRSTPLQETQQSEPLLRTTRRRSSTLRLKEPLLRTTRRRSSIFDTSTATIKQRQASDLPSPSEWPHRPVLVCVNTPVSASLHVPKYGTGPCPIGKPFQFSSDLFEGSCLVRLRGINNSDNPEGDEAYFTGRRRLFQTIVQGRFKEPLLLSEVLTGHEFNKPLKHLPHRWIVKAATNLIGKLAPGAEIQVDGNTPTMLASLAATSQVVRGDEPGNEPNIASTEGLKEDCSLLGGKFSSGKVSSTGRKLHLASPQRAEKYSFDTETVYTFDFYQSLLNVQTYSLDLGVANIGMASVLNGQPIQSLCKTRDGRYLWSFQIWHESLLPVEEKSGGKGKDNYGTI